MLLLTYVFIRISLKISSTFWDFFGDTLRSELQLFFDPGAMTSLVLPV